MRSYVRRRPGTSPSFWRQYNNDQIRIAASSMPAVPPGFSRKTDITEEIADFERRKCPPSAQFIAVSQA
jgi:hypothetical protein